MPSRDIHGSHLSSGFLHSPPGRADCPYAGRCQAGKRASTQHVAFLLSLAHSSYVCLDESVAIWYEPPSAPPRPPEHMKTCVSEECSSQSCWGCTLALPTPGCWCGEGLMMQHSLGHISCQSLIFSSSPPFQKLSRFFKVGEF